MSSRKFGICIISSKIAGAKVQRASQRLGLRKDFSAGACGFLQLAENQYLSFAVRRYAIFYELGKEMIWLSGLADIEI
ncbi:MAG: hypothetical protein A3J46_04800 [Candidatus Yanofskybacteria bacterium RIFCSPHIGHO2_02_FULL_41_11]|uniref:Uncharacterized protein n=1 Tax=Candidatus Yanofskybacteria bacterium RIFCSPHIGHO2_02_FULL_41_11 TaxID=1802675 RepID=A0A1F8FD48_9BACT|nr:MAG: hypothetical protein A3J46_04800 [Candidatus Yanofskybacteria bacterium RIFCSPHIGHO2_02_FULL_41_11]